MDQSLPGLSNCTPATSPQRRIASSAITSACSHCNRLVQRLGETCVEYHPHRVGWLAGRAVPGLHGEVSRIDGALDVHRSGVAAFGSDVTTGDRKRRTLR